MRAHQRTKRRPGSDVKMKIVRENEARIAKMLGSGMSVSAMCRRIGISRYTWYRYKAGQKGKVGHDGKGGQVQNCVEIAIFATM